MRDAIPYIGLKKSSFTNKQKRMETLLKYESFVFLFQKKIKMEFEERLRGEKVFKSARELAIQIRKDVEKIKRIFK